MILLLSSASKILDAETSAAQDLERAQKLHRIHEIGAAETALKRLIELHPKTESAREAVLLLKEIEETKKKPVPVVEEEKPVAAPAAPTETEAKCDTTAIGLVLPLTGAASTYGERTLAAVQMALGLPNLKPNTNPIWIQRKEGITLVVADSKSDAKETLTLTETLVNTHKVMAILGDILTDSAAAVAKKSQELGVTNLSLSRQNNLTQTGEWVFRLGMTTQKQTQAITKQINALSNAQKIVVLYPNNTLGKDMKNGIAIENVAIAYKPDETTFTQIAEKAADADVIFIPDFPKTVSYIVPALVSKGLLVSQHQRSKKPDAKPIQLIGPSSWSGPLLSQRLGTQIDGALFVDGIDWSMAPVMTFSAEFKQRKHSDPSIVEAQAYDAASIMKSILNLAKTRAEFRQKLQELPKWPGLTGQITFDSDRDSTAPLFWFEFQNGQSKLRNDKP